MDSEDISLLQRWRAGDRAAGDALIRRHYSYAFGVAMRRLRNSEDAAEATQQAMMVLVQRRDTIEGDFRKYLGKVIYFSILSQTKRRKEEPLEQDEPFAGTPARIASSMLVSREEEKLMIKALRRLPIDDQLLFYYNFVSEKTRTEIAETLGISQGVVYKKIHKAKERLRHQLEKFRDSPIHQSTMGGLNSWLASMQGKAPATKVPSEATSQRSDLENLPELAQEQTDSSPETQNIPLAIGQGTSLERVERFVPHEDDAEPDVLGLGNLLRENLDGGLHEVGPGVIIDGRWELLRQIGSGGFGRVFKAWHLQLDRTVAIKILDQPYANEMKQRFLGEAQLLAGIRSKHIIGASDYGELPDGTPYIVMELVEGRTLRHHLGVRMPLSRALELGEEWLRGLSEVHARGLIHSDIKPENIIIADHDGKARLLDFGLARSSLADDDRIGGTPPYMAPETLFNKAAPNARTDVYSAGAVLYEMLTGQLPRGHMNMGAGQIRTTWNRKPNPDPIRMHINMNVVNRPSVAMAALDRFVMRALDQDPARRPGSATEMLAELQAIVFGAGRSVRADGVASQIDEIAPRSSLSWPRRLKTVMSRSDILALPIALFSIGLVYYYVSLFAAAVIPSGLLLIMAVRATVTRMSIQSRCAEVVVRSVQERALDNAQTHRKS